MTALRANSCLHNLIKISLNTKYSQKSPNLNYSVPAPKKYACLVSKASLIEFTESWNKIISPHYLSPILRSPKDSISPLLYPGVYQILATAKMFTFVWILHLCKFSKTNIKVAFASTLLLSHLYYRWLWQNQRSGQKPRFFIPPRTFSRITSLQKPVFLSHFILHWWCLKMVKWTQRLRAKNLNP